MADSRLTFTETRQVFDNIAKIYQTIQAYVDGGFTGEGTNTLLYGLRYLLETRSRAWTSDSGIALVQPPIRNLLKEFDVNDSSGTLRLLAAKFGPIISAVCAHQTSYDTTYESFWDWFYANIAAAPNDRILGEVAELMNAAGICVDADYCVPPEYRKLARVTFTGAATLTLTRVNDIDPLLYTPKLYTPATSGLEVYCIARNVSPDEIALKINDAKDETDGPGDTGATDFTATIGAAIAAGQTVYFDAHDLGHQLCSVTGANTTGTTGGKTSDDFWIRTIRYRAAGF